MFFRRATNKVKNGDGNVQISGDVNTLEIGIPYAEHFKRVDKAVEQALISQREIRSQLELRHESEKAFLSDQLDAVNSELKKLEEVRLNPDEYFDMAADATATLSAALSGDFAAEFVAQVQQIKSGIASGDLAAAEEIINSVFERFDLNSKMEADLLDAQSSLAFLRLHLSEAESRAKRAFYLDPTISRLNGYLERLEIGDRRSMMLSEFQEGKLQLEAPEGSDEWVKIIATEVVIAARFGEMKHAKNLMQHLKKFAGRSKNMIRKHSIIIMVTQASLAALEYKHLDVVLHGKRAISLMEEVGEWDQLFVLRMKGNVGSALGEIGRLAEAIDLTTECVEGLKNLGDIAQYHYGIRLNNLGDFLTRDDKTEKAIPLLRESVQLAVDNLPEWHPSIFRRLGNLATAYNKIGLRPKAIATLKEIKFDATRLNDYDKESLVKVMMRLHSYCYKEGRWYEALGALLYVQEIGAEYLRDDYLEAVLSSYILDLRARLLTSTTTLNWKFDR
ncbi:hypothetical protein [uncultured Jannaschia sp.]|uniref:hypothetical protein n=1 Tax=uncultured Jannaschia sp. TaxID=293347 RepID=UPI002602F402|nr:hypothetical protein [uncultured Jannaschia sp.]